MSNKYIKKFNSFLNESLSEDELNDILDKISKNGIDSLSERDRLELDNYDNPNYDFKSDICNEISELVKKYGGIITMGEIQAESSPFYKQTDQEIHLIERLMDTGVEIVVYGGFEYDDEIREYTVNYDDLDNHTLLEIKELIMSAIDTGVLE